MQTRNSKIINKQTINSQTIANRRPLLLSIWLYLTLFWTALFWTGTSYGNTSGNDSEHLAVAATLNDYIEGTSYNRTEQISRAFHPTALLYLEKRDKSEWHVPVQEYVDLFKKRKANEFNGRVGEILSIDIDGRIATAKVAIILPERDTTYVDQILLKKFDTKAASSNKNQWLIVAKSAVPMASNDNGKRILFIASSQRTHGETDIPAGVSFSEIVNAWKTFKDAGYTVDFVSPEGGALPLSYVNARMDAHVQHMYMPEFMYAIAHSKSPEQIQPGKYAAVHYLGGSNAMYGVAENQAIQNIAMEIYEQHGGIVSSVCHGTAGIVNLKTKDGKYLVDGKRISGYPESFEKQDSEWFKQFPFHIQKTIEAHGGTFKHGARNTAHIEVDGRVITGQNHLSSEGVAREIIRVLEM